MCGISIVPHRPILRYMTAALLDVLFLNGSSIHAPRPTFTMLRNMRYSTIICYTLWHFILLRHVMGVLARFMQYFHYIDSLMVKGWRVVRAGSYTLNGIMVLYSQNNALSICLHSDHVHQFFTKSRNSHASRKSRKTKSGNQMFAFFNFNLQ